MARARWWSTWARPASVEQIAAAKTAGASRVVGFLGHLQADLMEASQRAGVDEVLTRGQFVQRLDDILRGA